MTNDLITGFQHRRAGLPSSVQSGYENLIRRWSMIPHGNCRDATQSRSVVHQNQSTAPGDDYVMREFILNDYFIDNSRKERPALMRKSPCHHILKILLRLQLFRDIREGVG